MLPPDDQPDNHFLRQDHLSVWGPTLAWRVSSPLLLCKQFHGGSGGADDGADHDAGDDNGAGRQKLTMSRTMTAPTIRRTTT
jgi:hypothetical protein